MISEKFKASFTGLDEETENVAAARKRNIPNAVFFIGRPTSLYFKNGSLDVVISPLPIITYKEIFRVLSPNGGVFILVVNPNTARMEVKILKELGFPEVALKGDLLIAKK